MVSLHRHLDYTPLPGGLLERYAGSGGAAFNFSAAAANVNASLQQQQQQQQQRVNATSEGRNYHAHPSYLDAHDAGGDGTVLILPSGHAILGEDSHFQPAHSFGRQQEIEFAIREFIHTLAT